MVTYEWTISALDCKVSENGLNNIVTTVHWRFRGEDEEGTTTELIGADSVGDPNPSEFTEYENLTKEVVVGWLEGILDVDSMKEKILNKIELIKNPVEVTLPLPN